MRRSRRSGRESHTIPGCSLSLPVWRPIRPAQGGLAALSADRNRARFFDLRDPPRRRRVRQSNAAIEAACACPEGGRPLRRLPAREGLAEARSGRSFVSGSLDVFDRVGDHMHPLDRVVLDSLEIPALGVGLNVAAGVGGAHAQLVLTGFSLPIVPPSAPCKRGLRCAELDLGPRAAAVVAEIDASHRSEPGPSATLDDVSPRTYKAR